MPAREPSEPLFLYSVEYTVGGPALSDMEPESAPYATFVTGRLMYRAVPYEGVDGEHVGTLSAVRLDVALAVREGRDVFWDFDFETETAMAIDSVLTSRGEFRAKVCKGIGIDYLDGVFFIRTLVLAPEHRGKRVGSHFVVDACRRCAHPDNVLVVHPTDPARLRRFVHEDEKQWLSETSDDPVADAARTTRFYLGLGFCELVKGTLIASTWSLPEPVDLPSLRNPATE